MAKGWHQHTAIESSVGRISRCDVWPPPAEPAGDLAISDQGREPTDTTVVEPENIEMLTPRYASSFWPILFLSNELITGETVKKMCKQSFSDFSNYSVHQKVNAPVVDVKFIYCSVMLLDYNKY